MNAGLQISMQSYAAEIGDTFTGHVTYSAEPDTDKPIRGLRVSLGYRTEGRGDTDAKVVQVAPITTDAFGNANQSFTLPVPPVGPISYDGRIIRVAWEIKATVDLARKRDHNILVPVMVLPQNGWGVYQYPHPLRAQTHNNI